MASPGLEIAKVFKKNPSLAIALWGGSAINSLVDQGIIEPLPHEPITKYGGEEGVSIGEPITTYGSEGGVPIGGAKKAPYTETDMPFQRPGMSGGRTYGGETGVPIGPEKRPMPDRREYLPNPEMSERRKLDMMLEDIFRLEDRDNFMRNPEMRRWNPELDTIRGQRRNPEGIEFPKY